MPSTYSPNLRIELIASGEQGNTWGGTTNNNLGTLIENAISGTVSIDSMPSNTYTLTVLNGANDNARNMYIKVSSSTTLSAAGTIIAPAVSKMYVITNSSSGSFALTLKTASSPGISIPNGATRTVFFDGTDFVDTVTATKSLLLNADATLALQAVTKQQMDAALALKISKDGSIAMTGPLTLAGGAPTGTQAVSKTYADSFYLPLTNPTLITPLTLSSADPTGFQATSRSFTDFTYVAKTGSTMTGALTLYSVVPTGTWQAVPKSYVDNVTVTSPNLGIVTGVNVNGSPTVAVTLNPATTSALGGVKVDGTSITINGSGVISAATGGGGTVTGVSVATANGFTGSSSGGATPALTIALNSGLSGLLAASGGSIVAASGSYNINITGSSASCTGNAATASGPSGGGTFVTSSNIGSQSVTYASSAGSANTANSASSATNAGDASNLGGFSAASYLLKSGGTMTGALSVQNTGSPAKYITVNTINESGNYYPAIISKNTASTAYADIVVAQENSLGARQLPLICGPNGNVLIGYLLKMTSLVSGGTTTASIDNDGTLIRTTSDASLKENVEELSGGLLQALALNPVYYDWIDKQRFGDARQIGFIAQEVQPIVPEAISQNPDNTLSLDYAKLTATLTSAIQELNAKVEALTAEVNTLKGA